MRLKAFSSAAIKAVLILGAYALPSPAGSQVRLEGPGAPPPRAGNANVRERTELPHFWAGIGASVTVAEVREHLRQFGPMPIAFTGAMRFGSERDGTPAYANATVVIHRVYVSPDDAILGLPAMLVDFEITEGSRAGMRTRRVPLADTPR